MRSDVLLQTHSPSSLDQVLPAHATELRIVAKQVRELGALLDQVDPGQAGDLMLKVRHSKVAGDEGLRGLIASSAQPLPALRYSLGVMPVTRRNVVVK
jgi:hypothetical protein